MRILVTGGAGFIGSVCVEVLLQMKHDVLAADDLSSGSAEAVLPPARLSVVRRDDPLCWHKVVNDFHPEAVMHFAATAQIDCSMTDPGPVYTNNVSNTLALLEAMRAGGVGKFIFSSTAAVYGNPESVPITEEHPCRPINAYGDTKLAIEHALGWYRSIYGLRTAIFRYFNVAGATERCGEMRHAETHLIPLLMDAAIGAIPVFRMYGDDYPTPDGTCVRDYVHVLDVVDAHIRALDRIEQVNGEVFNLGTGEGFSVKQMYDAACRATRKSIPLARAERRPGDPAVLVADAGKARRVLGWNPVHSTLDGMFDSASRWRLKMRAGTASLKEA
jgi:UDP-glucose 4-epimerase